MPGPTASGVSFPVAPYRHLKMGARTLAKIAKKRKNAAPGTLIYVSIKTGPDPLFSITCARF